MASNDNILRLKVESQEYDSKLKRATQGLQSYIDHCRNSGKTLNQASADTMNYIKAIGRMNTVNRTATGQLNEIKSAFVNLSYAYKQMTDEEKNNPVGKALYASLDQLKTRLVSTKQQIDEINSSVQGMGGKAGAAGGMMSSLGGMFSGGGMSGIMSVFGGNMLTKVAGWAMDAANGLKDMVVQGIELAKAGEGVRLAFDRLNQPGLLNQLREATHGTVTDLELMKAAIKFDNFKLPLEDLATYLAFAQQKAKDTGESIDYLVNSIVMGLGRQSVQILDNLGISASEIRKRMAEGGDMTKAVADIIREEMAKAGGYVETAADRSTQAEVKVQNALEDLGTAWAPLTKASNEFWNSLKLGAINALKFIKPVIEALGLGGVNYTYQNLNRSGGAGSQSIVEKQISSLRGSNYKNAKYNASLNWYSGKISELSEAQKYWKWWRNEGYKTGNTKNQRQYAKYANYTDERFFSEIAAYDKMRTEYKKAAKEVMHPTKVNVETDTAEQNVASLTKKLKQLQKERKEAVKSGDKDKMKLLDKQISETRKEIKALDPKAFSGAGHHTVSDKESAANKVKNAEKAYSTAMENASVRLEKGIDDTLAYKRRELSAQERLFEAYGDAYATYKNPDYKTKQGQAATKIAELTAEIQQDATAQAALKDSAKKLENAQTKLAEAQEQLAMAEESGSLKSFYAAQGKVTSAQAEVNKLSGENTPADLGSIMPNFSEENITAFTAKLKEQLASADFGTPLYENLSSQLQNMTTLSDVISNAIKAGLDPEAIGAKDMFAQIFNADNIDESALQGMVDAINAKLKGGVQLKIAAGGGLEQANQTVKGLAENAQYATKTIGSIGQAFNAIEDPAAKVAGTVMQAIAQVALGFAYASTADANKGTIAWIAAIAAGLATMTSTVAAIHSSTGYSEGGEIKGHSYSGDNLMANNGSIGLNAGEIVLNKAMAANVATALTQNEGGGQSGSVAIDGESLIVVLNNTYKRKGYGEIVTSRRM